MRIILRILNVAGAVALWLVSSAITSFCMLLAFYLILKLPRPDDPSVSDAFAWGVIFGAPAWTSLSLILGVPAAIGLFAFGGKLARAAKASAANRRAAA